MEEEGLATVLISLIKEHSQTMQPPRALWVPFELGRPLGLPNDPGFQHQVLAAAFDLLKAPQGPVLADFPHDAPDANGGQPGAWACPVDLGQGADDLSQAGRQKQAVLAEISQLATWYGMSLKQSGRTTFGASGMEPHAIGEFLCGFLEGDQPGNPREDMELPWVVKLASEDLKAYYLEAALAKPAAAPPGSAELNDWFWGRTAAGRLYLKLKEIFMQSRDETTQILGRVLMVPVSQAHRGNR
jgi:hypothetical protein